MTEKHAENTEKGTAMTGYWVVDGKRMTDTEYEERRQQEQAAKKRIGEEATELTRKLAENYAALNRLIELHPEVAWFVNENEEHREHEIYERLRKNLVQADGAPRCRKIKEDGTSCRSPKMKDHIYCYAHRQMLDVRAEKLVLPPLEDANAIQMAIMRVQKALIDDEISEKKAGLLLYSLQLALANANKTTFGQAADEDMVTETTSEHAGMVELEKKEDRRRWGKPATEALGHEEEETLLPRLPVGSEGRMDEPYANLG